MLPVPLSGPSFSVIQVVCLYIYFFCFKFLVRVILHFFNFYYLFFSSKDGTDVICLWSQTLSKTLDFLFSIEQNPPKYSQPLTMYI